MATLHDLYVHKIRSKLEFYSASLFTNRQQRSRSLQEEFAISFLFFFVGVIFELILIALIQFFIATSPLTLFNFFYLILFNIGKICIHYIILIRCKFI